MVKVWLCDRVAQDQIRKQTSTDPDLSVSQDTQAIFAVFRELSSYSSATFTWSGGREGRAASQDTASHPHHEQQGEGQGGREDRQVGPYAQREAQGRGW